MAKAKEKESFEGTQEDFVNRMTAEVDKDYGEGVMVDGLSIISKTPTVVPIGPALDIITSGGIEEGSWVGITGNPKTGKSSLCLSIAANCQKPEYGNRPVYYIKIEGRLSITHLKGIKGLDLRPGKFYVIQSTKDKILTAQDFLRIVGSILRSVPGAIVIIDSASALCDESEMNSDIGDQAYAAGNKLFSKFIRTNAQVVTVNRSIVFVITHLIANIGMGKSGYTERVARAAQYQYDYMLRTKVKTAWKVGNQQIGLQVNWVCNTSKLGPPNMSMDSYLRFGVGIDKLFESIKLGQDVGLIKVTGSWIRLEYLTKPRYSNLIETDEAPKFQGNEKVYQALLEHPEWAEPLEKEVMAMAGAFGSCDDE